MIFLIYKKKPVGIIEKQFGFRVSSKNYKKLIGLALFIVVRITFATVNYEFLLLKQENIGYREKSGLC